MAKDDSIPQSRICTKCGAEKPLTEFTKAAGGKYGRSARCRACAAAYARANREHINELSLARYHRLQEPKRAVKAQARAERLAKRLAESVKLCSRCKLVKPKSDFGANRSQLDGLRTYCNDCKAAESREYRQKNPDAARASSEAWAKAHPEKRIAQRRRHQAGVSYRIHHAVSQQIYYAIGRKKSQKTERLLGYSIAQLMRHLERQFNDGMSWENYGDWHIDHIVPLASFKASSLNDVAVRQAWCLTNLRPLWGIENLRKNARRIYLI